MSEQRMTRDDPCRYVFVDRPRCPKCSSLELKIYATRPEPGTEAITRYVRCKKCPHKFLLVSE